MFSIINIRWARALVWYSLGSETASTLAPRRARPAREDGRAATHRASALPAGDRPGCAANRPGDPQNERWSAGCSHTPAYSDMRESSHTQEFTGA
jgi:hypothetical protein